MHAHRIKCMRVGAATANAMVTQRVHPSKSWCLRDLLPPAHGPSKPGWGGAGGVPSVAVPRSICCF
eukprot:2848256-Alexandrium_andersonii.AAC.1